MEGLNNVGYLEFCTKNDKTPKIYYLKVGSNIIGASLSADIRIKAKGSDYKPIFCDINVEDNGLATLEKACKDDVLINGSKITKIQILKNKDKIDVAGKTFVYVNENRVPTEVANFIKTEKRYSLMPSFKMTPSKTPVSINKHFVGHLSTTTSKELLRRSSMSRLSPWATISTSDGKRSLLLPSTLLKVRRALFVDSNDQLVFLSLSGRDQSLFQDPGVFFNSLVHDSPLAIDLNKKLNSQNSPLNDSSDVRGVNNLFKPPKIQKSPVNYLRDVWGIKKIPKTFKVQKSPINDLTKYVTGVKKLFRTPKVQKFPINDLTKYVTGVKKLFRTPKVQKSPLNDLTDVKGVKEMFGTPKNQKSLMKLRSQMNSKLVLDEGETSQKRSTRSQKQQKTIDQQVSATEDAETPNLKKGKDDEMPVLKRNLRSRQNAIAEIDINKNEARGRARKQNVDENTTNQRITRSKTRKAHNEDMRENKSTTRGRKRKNEIKEQNAKLDEISPMKTRSGRVVQTEVEVKPMRRRAK